MKRGTPALAEETRAALRCVPTGVAVVTAVREGEARGITINAFTSVSLEPPTLLVCINRQARSYLYIAHSRCFALNVLAAEQVEIAERFSGKRRERQFEGLATTSGNGDIPLIEGALAHFECVVSAEHEVGSHSIFIAEIERASHRVGEPLGYFDGAFRTFALERIP